MTNETTNSIAIVLTKGKHKHKDNPSGLAEHADELRVPVRFGR